MPVQVNGGTVGSMRFTIRLSASAAVTVLGELPWAGNSKGRNRVSIRAGVVGTMRRMISDGMPGHDEPSSHASRRYYPRRGFEIGLIPPQAEGASPGHLLPFPNADMGGPSQNTRSPGS